MASTVLAPINGFQAPQMEARPTQRFSTFLNPSTPTRYQRGLCGLHNMGNTCFMNSALQCLSNVPELTNYFLRERHTKEINEKNPLGTQGLLAKEYAQLLRNLWSGQTKAIQPLKLKMVIGKFAPRFNGYFQHDSQELTAFLLDGLHEDLNRVKDKPKFEEKEPDGRDEAQAAIEAWQDYTRSNNSIIIDLLHGQLKSSLTCDVCKKVSIKFDSFCFLSVPIPRRPPKERSAVVVPTKEEDPEKLRIYTPKEEKNREQLEEEKEEDETQETTAMDESLRMEVERPAEPSDSQQSVVTKYSLNFWWILFIARDWLFRPWFSWALDLYQHIFAGPISLEQCLHSFFSVDYLRGEDMYKCERCKKLRNGTKHCSITRLPEVLIIHLKRFRNEGTYNVKLGSRVAFPLCDLDMRPFMSQRPGNEADDESTRYDLCGLITHKGQNMEHGHYIAYCRHPMDQEWYEFDDMHVTKVDQREVLAQEAYVLFYKRNGTLGDEDRMMRMYEEQEEEDEEETQEGEEEEEMMHTATEDEEEKIVKVKMEEVAETEEPEKEEMKTEVPADVLVVKRVAEVPNVPMPMVNGVLEKEEKDNDVDMLSEDESQ